jgi:hypothetical protein
MLIVTAGLGHFPDKLSENQTIVWIGQVGCERIFHYTASLPRVVGTEPYNRKVFQ